MGLCARDLVTHGHVQSSHLTLETKFVALHCPEADRSRDLKPCLKVELAPVVILLTLITTPTVADVGSELARCELEAQRLFPAPQ